MKAEFNNFRAVVVDDSRNFRELMRGILRAFGFRRVDTFGGPEEVLDCVCQNAVDILIIDEGLGHDSGVELARVIRNDTTVVNRHAPIILITGLASRAVIRASVAVGVDTVLSKPVSPQMVFDRIRHVISAPLHYAGSGSYFGPEIKTRLMALDGRSRANNAHVPVLDLGSAASSLPRRVPRPAQPAEPAAAKPSRRQPGGDFAALRPSDTTFVLD